MGEKNTKKRIFGDPIFLARIFFVLLVVWVASGLGWRDQQENRDLNVLMIYMAVALGGALVVVLYEVALGSLELRNILLGGAGCLIGLIFAKFFLGIFPEQFLLGARGGTILSIAKDDWFFFGNIIFAYIGTVLALRHADWFVPGKFRFMLVNPSDHPKVLDSSVIIDGRIVEIIRLGLIGGRIIVPSFVLKEIQRIADSSDPLRKARGRRGLDVLENLREACQTLEIIENDFPEESLVDQKLILLCNSMTADLVTNDYNLHKVAQVQRINIININELADAMKPSVYIGEVLTIHIVKPGKERSQGIGYLRDGTMVVVDDAENRVGEDCEIVVSNVLTNPSGRLTFARLVDHPSESDQRGDDNIKVVDI